MRLLSPFNMVRLSLGLVVMVSVIGAASHPTAAAAALASRRASERSTANVSREYMTSVVTLILDSMVAHDPFLLPVAPIYKATENSHPAALDFMTAWRTITKAGPPSLLAIDTTNATAYFSLDVSEGNDAVQTVLRGRVAVVDEHITELEIFMNRNRGDHGFSYSAVELPTNYGVLMSPPANRTKASRDTLWELSEALFAESSNFTVDIGDDCQFTELGWKVIDPGANSTGSYTPLGCSWPDQHPTDDNPRLALVIDEELGFVVTSGIIPGTVFPYSNISAFIPNHMTDAQEAQEVWIQEMEALGILPLLSPTGATGDTMEVLQYYDNALQAMQINVYLSGPNMTSPWL